MDDQRLDSLLRPYNPWWQPINPWEQVLPDYQRPIVQEVQDDLYDLPQMVSITGPRRVGKSTAVRHLISKLIRHQQTDCNRILYFSFDEPEVFGSPEAQRVIIDLLVQRLDRGSGPGYLFLDEVQRLPKWELYLKKHYFREKNREVDFVLTYGGNQHLPIEVKYRMDVDQIGHLKFFMKRYGLKLGVIITRDKVARFEDGLLFLPLRYFLLAT